jgi:hypothetical protein
METHRIECERIRQVLRKAQILHRSGLVCMDRGLLLFSFAKHFLVLRDASFLDDEKKRLPTTLFSFTFEFETFNTAIEIQDYLTVYKCIYAMAFSRFYLTTVKSQGRTNYYREKMCA